MKTTLRLPPLHVVFPPGAIYRQYPLPPELFETWALLRGLSWVNKYTQTPPASIDELLPFHHDLKRRGLEYRLERLEYTGWLTVIRAIGKTNIYIPTVPVDRPIDYSCKSAPCGEPTSLRSVSSEELARHPEESTIEASASTSHKTHAMDCTGFSSTVVVADLSNSEIENRSTTTSTNNDPCNETAFVKREWSEDDWQMAIDALYDLDLGSDEAIQKILGRHPDFDARGRLIDFSHVTVEYLENWVCYRQSTATKHHQLGSDEVEYDYKLGGGYFRMEIRAGHDSPYVASDAWREKYRRKNYDEWEREQMDEPEVWNGHEYAPAGKVTA